MSYQKEEIIICPECKGSGKIECNELEDAHKGDYIYWDVECDKCKGYGRVVQITTFETRLLSKSDIHLRRKT